MCIRDRIIGVSADGHPDEAMEFLHFLAEPERMQSYLDDFGFLAPREDVLERQFPEDAQMQEFVRLLSLIHISSHAPWKEEEEAETPTVKVIGSAAMGSPSRLVPFTTPLVSSGAT